MGRKKSTEYLPYEDAKEYIRKKGLRSRKQYRDWRKANNAMFLPFSPDKVYVEWESWNAFTGTTGSFEGTLAKKKAEHVVKRPFWEAVRYAQQVAKDYNLNTMNEWFEWYDRGMCPADIPKRPHQCYPEFDGKGWGVWLGTSVRAKQVVHQENVAVFVVGVPPNVPANLLMTILERGGISALKHKWDDCGMKRAYRVYKWDDQLAAQVGQCFRQHCFEKEDGWWLAPNVNALLFDLDGILEFAVPPNQLR